MKNEEVITVSLSLPAHEATYEEEIEFRNFIDDLASCLTPETTASPAYGGGPGGTTTIEMLILFVSGGVFTATINAIYNLLQTYLQRYQSRELTFERDGNKITIKGQSPEEEMKWLRELFPEALQNVDSEGENSK